jgi:hypothetical protein
VLHVEAPFAPGAFRRIVGHTEVIAKIETGWVLSKLVAVGRLENDLTKIL